jgi:hypothetical protein
MNNLVKITATVFVLLLALTPAAPGQSLRAGAAKGAAVKEPGAQAKGPVDEVENLLDRYMVALGGLALFKIRTRVVRGRLEMSESPNPGTFETYEKMPGKSMMVVNAPNGQFLSASDGDRRWQQMPWGASRVVAAVGDVKLLEQAASGKGFKWRNAFSSARLKGRAVVEGHETIVLAATARGGEPLLVYFDAETTLPRKVERVVRPAAEGADYVKAAYIDSYATVDGVKVPAVIRQIYTTCTLTFRATEVRHNVPINDALFETPKGK